jgi:hypothetical protein
MFLYNNKKNLNFFYSGRLTACCGGNIRGFACTPRSYKPYLSGEKQLQTMHIVRLICLVFLPHILPIHLFSCTERPSAGGEMMPGYAQFSRAQTPANEVTRINKTAVSDDELNVLHELISTKSKKKLTKFYNFMAICSGILSLFSLFFTWTPFIGLTIAATGFVLGWFLMKRSKKRRRNAILGFLIGGLMTIIYVIIVLPSVIGS